MKNLSKLFFFAFVIFSRQAPAQQWDNSGNALLKGTYYFREVVWLVGDNSGSLSRAIAVYGGISFDGNGNYAISNNSAQVLDSNGSGPQNYTTTGTYSISASGYGFLSSPISTGDSIYGLVSHGIFVASSTENNAGFNDLLIAAPVPSPVPTNAFFQGTYSMAQWDIVNGAVGSTRESAFQLKPDGNGNIGIVSASGYIAGTGSRVVTQNFSGVRYRFSNGAAIVSFGGSLTSSNLLSGDKYLYFSPDGNFVFGGSPTSWDMIVGVRAGSTAPNFNGLYYEAGVEQDQSQLASGFADLRTEYGSRNVSPGLILGHQRVLSVFNNNPVDFTYSDSYSSNSDGTFDDPINHYTLGAGGAVGIAIEKPPLFGIKALVQAPTFSGEGVYINPTGILNNGSFVPFTAGVAPGELISIYGTNLASKPLVDATLPSTLGGVQVFINSRPAPIYLVSPDRIIAAVPFATSEVVAAIQVVNNGQMSNTVTNYVNLTEPGIFLVTSGGVNYGAVVHPDFSLVTPSNPAHSGETLQVFLTGLGSVNPPVSDGTPGPFPPSNTTSTITAALGGVQAPVSFAGLAPTLTGLYQVNVQVPAGVAAGNVFLDLAGPDSYNSLTKIAVAAGSAVRPAETSRFRAARPGSPQPPKSRRRP